MPKVSQNKAPIGPTMDINLVIQKTKMETINTLLNMYPDLVPNRHNIIKEVCKAKSSIGSSNTLSEVVLDQIIINGETYYKDEFNNIIDENTKLVGMMKKVDNKEIYYSLEAKIVSKLSELDKAEQEYIESVLGKKL
jgi:hypothetical protein